MGRVRCFHNDLELDELHLHGHLFTWSNERSHPTLERIDRMFVSSCWNATFPGPRRKRCRRVAPTTPRSCSY
jgi:hypothetical protein